MTARLDNDEMKALQTALAALDQRGALHLDPAVLVAAAATAVRTRSFGSAIDLLKLALARDPQSPRAWALLGTALAGEGRAQEAERAYSEATNLDDDDLLSAVALAELQAARGDVERARALLEYVVLKDRGSKTLRDKASALLAALPAPSGGAP